MKTSITRKQYSLALALLGVSSLSLGATVTDTFTVTAEVENACIVSAANLDFGTVNVLSGADVDATADISVTCTNGASYEVGLDGGGEADVANRAMNDGATGTLNYSLYSDAGRTTNWGNTTAVDVVAGTGSGSAQTHTVYGRIPQGQNTVTAGSYTDTITATVTY